jgi:hypothetical protein
LRPDAKPHEEKAWVEWQTRHVLSHSRKPRDMEHNLPELPDDDTAAEAERRTLVADLMAQLQDEDRQLMQMRLEGYSADEETNCQGTCTLRLPAAGIYMVQIADRPARKVVVQ